MWRAELTGPGMDSQPHLLVQGSLSGLAAVSRVRGRQSGSRLLFAQEQIMIREIQMPRCVI